MASDGAGSALLGSAFWREEVEPMRGRGEVPSVGLLVIVGVVSDMVTLAWFRRGLGRQEMKRISKFCFGGKGRTLFSRLLYDRPLFPQTTTSFIANMPIARHTFPIPYAVDFTEENKGRHLGELLWLAGCLTNDRFGWSNA